MSDLRGGIDVLLAQVVRGFAGGAQPHHAYVFANRRTDRLKVLVYDGAGMWLCTRRLQAGGFAWPGEAGGAMALTSAQFDWLAGVNYLGRRVASRRNVTRGLVVVDRLFGCSAIHSQEAPRRGRRRPPVGAMYSWFNPLSAASVVRCRAVRCPRVPPAGRERVVSMPYGLLGAERPARRRRRRFLCRRFRLQPG